VELVNLSRHFFHLWVEILWEGECKFALDDDEIELNLTSELEFYYETSMSFILIVYGKTLKLLTQNP